jgi:hypothetical protein
MKPKKNDIIIDIAGDKNKIRMVSKGVCYIVGSSDVFFIKYLEPVSKGVWKDR